MYMQMSFVLSQRDAETQVRDHRHWMKILMTLVSKKTTKKYFAC